jgi:hypothetical protein
MRKLPLVSSEYPDEVNMISFKRINTWEAASLRGFQYDNVTDNMIKKALKYPKLDNIDCNIDWEDDEFLQNDDSVKDTLKHAIRVAKLIQIISAGGGVIPITIDTFCADYCCSCVSNGHHRIRALQYLGYTHFPASCSGIVSLINKIIDKRVDKKIIFK